MGAIVRYMLLGFVLVGCDRLPPAGTTPFGPDPTTDPDPTGVDPTVPDPTDPDPTKPIDDGVFRIATWNVQYLGNVGSAEFEAAVAVLDRIDAEVVGLNEVWADEAAALQTLADRLGYPHVIMGESTSFGTLTNAILTREAPLDQQVWHSPDLSTDDGANEMARLPVSVDVAAPDGTVVTVLIQHWKSGWDDTDAFRRTVESRRCAQAVLEGDVDHIIVMGDVNAEIEDGTEWPYVWNEIPAGMPSSYWLGFDLWTEMTDVGLENNPFVPFLDEGLSALDVVRGNGDPGTRPVSGRRLDYLILSDGLIPLGSLVYDSRDEGQITVPLSGSPLDAAATADASDHLPVFVDL